MKKIMFILLMVMGLMGSLYALDTGQVGCDVENTQTSGCNDVALSSQGDEAVNWVKVNILHKDTLSYSLVECAKIGNDIQVVKQYSMLNYNYNYGDRVMGEGGV